MMSDERRKRDAYRFAEACLYGFLANKARLATLADALEAARASSSAHGQRYDGQRGGGGIPTSPVEARYMSIEALEAEIARLHLVVDPIQRLSDDLALPCILPGSDKARARDVMARLYLGGAGAEIVADDLGMSSRTLYRVKHGVVEMAMAYLAL